MFSIPFGRILWKEYRVNRSLWLACLVIGVLIHVITCLSTLGHPPSDRANGLIAVAAFIPVMYAIGCGAIMFASEREDGTSDWLLTLSASPLPTLLGKVAIAVVSTMALQIAMVLSSLILFAGAKPDAWWPGLVPFGVFALIWSCLGSVLSRRVLTSVFTAAFWLFVLTFVLQAIIDFLGYDSRNDMSYSRWQILWVTNGLITFAVVCWLGWRWCHGNYVDGSLLENFMSGTNVFVNKLVHRTAEPQRLPLHAEYDQSWRRSWQRLVWQERHRSRLPIALLQIVGALNFILVPTWLIAGERSTVCGLLWFCICAICFVTPIAMGWLSYQVDSSLQQPRFLVNRGISHSMLWLVKQCVWLPPAVFLPLMMGTVSILTVCLISGQERTNILHRILAESSFARPHEPPGFLWVYRAIWFVLLSYACGQLASLLIRRTVIAILASAFFVYLIGMWYGLIEICHLPLGWPLALPFVAMMLITLWQMKPWLLEDQSWVRRAKIAASLIAIPVVLLTLLCCVRVGQVYFAQRVDPSFVMEFELHAQARSKIESSFLPAKPTLERLEKIVLGSHDADPAVAGVVLQMIEQNRGSLLSIDMDKPEESNSLKVIREALEKRSHQLMDSGRLVEALEYQLANLKLARMNAEGGIMAWYSVTRLQRTALEELISWANHPKQTVDSLREGIVQIEQEFDKFPSLSGSVVKSYIQDRNNWVLASRGEVFLRLLENGVNPSAASQLLTVLFLLPTERMRTSLLLTREAELNYAKSTIMEAELASPQMMIDRASVKISYPEIGAELQQLEMTTPILRLTGLRPSFCEKFIKNRQTEIRATLTRLYLIAYRLEHGALPDRLVQLLPAVKQVNLIDPWSGQMFDYYPTFLFSTGSDGFTLFPVNSNELMPIKSSDKPYDSVGPEHTLRIFLNEPMSASIPDTVVNKERFYHKLFPIPAQSKLDSE